MDSSVIAAIAITVAVVIAAIVALVARGKMKAVARFLHLELEVDAGRDAPDPPSAVIDRGDAGRDAEARSTGSATIRRTKAGRDIKAHGGDTSAPKD
jgi:hypothetical protein